MIAPDRRHFLIALLGCGAGACAGARPDNPSATALVNSRNAAPIFEFHSGFWLNLHLRLHYAATGRRPPPIAAPTPPFDPAWDAALHYYKTRFGERGGFGLLFDEELVSIGRRLSDVASMPSLLDSDAELARHLRAVAEVTRVEWDTQDRTNMRWVHELEPKIAAFGEPLQRDLEAVYGAPWQKEPIRVDVSAFAGPVGAYTVEKPAHTIISTADPSYAGDASLEMIFHEASHLLTGPLEKMIGEAAAKRGKKPPDDLWHAVLFYATGEVVKRHLPPGYLPFATRNGVWDRWPTFLTPLQTHVQPYLDHKVSMQAAVDALVDQVLNST